MVQFWLQLLFPSLLYCSWQPNTLGIVPYYNIENQKYKPINADKAIETGFILLFVDITFTGKSRAEAHVNTQEIRNFEF